MTLLADHDAGLMILTISEPERRNPITPELAIAIMAELESANSENKIRAVLLRGAGGNFSSGGDLRAMPPANAAAAHSRLQTYADLIGTMTRSSLPIVCALEGSAAGIALGLAMACDVIVANDDAKLLFPFTRLGLFPDGGLAHSLAGRIGPGRAKAMLLLGDSVSAQRALEIGLVDHLAPAGTAVDVATGIARDLTERAPLSMSSIKAAFSAGVHELAPTLEHERITQTRLYFSDDFREGKQSFFEKRPPNFVGF